MSVKTKITFFNSSIPTLINFVILDFILYFCTINNRLNNEYNLSMSQINKSYTLYSLLKSNVSLPFWSFPNYALGIVQKRLKFY